MRLLRYQSRGDRAEGGIRWSGAVKAVFVRPDDSPVGKDVDAARPTAAFVREWLRAQAAFRRSHGQNQSHR